jgi:hypothetical protein
VLLPGPEQVLLVLVLLPVFPWPLVVSVVVVVWLFVLLPTLVVLEVVHMAVPFSLVKVPPEDVHCCSDEAANATVGPKASRDTVASIKAPNRRGMRFPPRSKSSGVPPQLRRARFVETSTNVREIRTGETQRRRGSLHPTAALSAMRGAIPRARARCLVAGIPLPAGCCCLAVRAIADIGGA